MAMEEQAKPTVQPGELVIKVAYAGICGSELSGYLGHTATRDRAIRLERCVEARARQPTGEGHEAN